MEHVNVGGCATTSASPSLSTPAPAPLSSRPAANEPLPRFRDATKMPPLLLLEAPLPAALPWARDTAAASRAANDLRETKGSKELRRPDKLSMLACRRNDIEGRGKRRACMVRQTGKHGGWGPRWTRT